MITPKAIPHAASTLLLTIFLCFTFFWVGRYQLYPWWHYMGNDIDGAHAAQTISLLNGSELTFIYHPAATIYSVHGAAYRLLSLGSPSHQALLHMENIRNENDAEALIETGVRTSRIISFWTAVLLAILVYTLIFVFTRSWLVSTLFAFYICSSEAFLYHTHVIRAETLNVLFLLAAVLAAALFLQREAGRRRPFQPSGRLAILGILAGLCLGFSVLSKIQIGAALILFLASLSAYIFTGKAGRVMDERRMLWPAVGAGLAALFLMPWWAIQRPGFLSQAFLNSLYVLDDYRKVYGPAPSSFTLLFALLLGAFLLLPAAVLFFLRQRPDSAFLRRCAYPAALWPWMAIGGILAAYAVLLPVSTSLVQYADNTQRLLYAVLTNSLFGGFLAHRVIEPSTFTQIIQAHKEFSSILGINVYVFAAVAALVSAARLAAGPASDRQIYVTALLFLFTGFLMDILATMRMNNDYLVYYTLYSVCFLGVGLALWTAAELSWGRLPDRWRPAAAAYVMVVLIAAQSGAKIIEWSRKPRASGQSRQSPAQQVTNLISHGKPFWRIATDAMRMDN